MKQNYPAFIYLRVTSDDSKLEIARIDESHNHAMSSMLFSNLPNQRRLAPQTKSEVIELMDMKTNKKLIQSKIHDETGKKITLRDLSSIKSTEKLKHRPKNFEETIEEIKNMYKCTIELLVHYDGTLLEMFLQDSRMKIEFENFPEMVCADATYKLIDLKIPLYVLLVENGNGQSEVAALGLLVNEEKETLAWFFKKFKELNPTSINTRVFITDRHEGADCLKKSV